MPKRTRDYHEFLLEQLTDAVFAAEYLNEARQDSQKMFLKALRNVAESRRMAVLAEQTGLNRESLYKSLSEDGNPRLDTYDSVLSALGIDYEFKPKQAMPSQSTPPRQSGTQIIREKPINPFELAGAWTTTINFGASPTRAFIASEPTGEQIQSDIPMIIPHVAAWGLEQQKQAVGQQ